MRSQCAQGLGTRSSSCSPVSRGSTLSAAGGVPTGCQPAALLGPQAVKSNSGLLRAQGGCWAEEGPWHRDGFAQREQVRPSPPSGKQVDRSPAAAR